MGFLFGRGSKSRGSEVRGQRGWARRELGLREQQRQLDSRLNQHQTARLKGKERERMEERNALDTSTSTHRFRHERMQQVACTVDLSIDVARGLVGGGKEDRDLVGAAGGGGWGTKKKMESGQRLPLPIARCISVRFCGLTRTLLLAPLSMLQVHGGESNDSSN